MVPSLVDRILDWPTGSRASWALLLAALGLATVMRLALDVVSDGIAPFLFHLPAILLAAVAGGIAIGAVATLASGILCWWLFVPPRFSFSVNTSEMIALAGFMLVACLLIAFAGRLRGMHAALRSLNVALERRVAERGAALEAESRRREAAEDRARQSQRLESIGQLTGGVAHDYNNLLTVVIGSLSVVRRALEAGPAPEQTPRLRRLIDAALDAGRRGATLNRRLLAFARRQALQPVTVDANALVAGLSDLLRRTLGDHVAVEAVLAGGLWPIAADATELEAAIVNLAVNARDAMPGGGKLTIETANARLDDAYAASHAEVVAGQYVLVAVSDTGAGMTEAVMDRAFEPFFTTRPFGAATGLGLSQVFGFVKQSGGHVKLYSAPGQGTTVRIYLPRLLGVGAPAPPASPAVPNLPGAAPNAECVLLVEDDPGVRGFAVEALRLLGYRVAEAADGLAAIALAETEPGIQLLVTDVGLPNGMNGRQVADAVLRLRPGLPVLFMSAYAPNAIVHGGVLDPGVRLLPKPFTAEDLAAKVREALDSAG